MTWNAVPYNAVVQVPGEQTRRAYFTGAGAAAPTVAASTTVAGMHNLASAKAVAQVTIVRNGAGDYTFTFIKDASPGLLLDVKANVRGTTDLAINVDAASLDANNQLVVRVKTWTQAGVATDAAAADTIVLDIVGTNTRAS